MTVFVRGSFVQNQLRSTPPQSSTATVRCFYPCTSNRLSRASTHTPTTLATLVLNTIVYTNPALRRATLHGILIFLLLKLVAALSL